MALSDTLDKILRYFFPWFSIEDENVQFWSCGAVRYEKLQLCFICSKTDLRCMMFLEKQKGVQWSYWVRVTCGVTSCWILFYICFLVEMLCRFLVSTTTMCTLCTMCTMYTISWEGPQSKAKKLRKTFFFYLFFLFYYCVSFFVFLFFLFLVLNLFKWEDIPARSTPSGENCLCSYSGKK